MWMVVVRIKSRTCVERELQWQHGGDEMLEMLLQMTVVSMKSGELVPCRGHDAVGERRGTIL